MSHKHKKTNQSRKNFVKSNTSSDFALRPKDLEDFNDKAYNLYSNEFFPGSTYMTLSFYDEDKVKEEGYESFYKPILHYMWRTDPNNWERMLASLKKYWAKFFPTNPNMNLGIKSDYTFDSFKQKFLTTQTRRCDNGYKGELFRYAFSSDYIRTLATAEKVGLYHYETPKTAKKRRLVDVVGLNVDGETLIGEIETVFGRKSKLAPTESGSVKFTLYYQGNPDIPIEIMRDDFRMTGTSHGNKIDENYHLIIDKRVPHKTKYTHRHYLNDTIQLAFSNFNQSINVEPTPVNKNGKGEKYYSNILDVRQDTISTIGYNDKVMDERFLQSKCIKKIIDNSLHSTSKSKRGKIITTEEIRECQDKYNKAISSIEAKDHLDIVVEQSEQSKQRFNIRKLYRMLKNSQLVLKFVDYFVRPAQNAKLSGTSFTTQRPALAYASPSNMINATNVETAEETSLTL